MKVLHIQKLRGIAGSENYLLQILPAQRAAGLDVEFLALVEQLDMPVNAAFRERLAAAGVPYRELRWGLLPATVAKLAWTIRRARPDVVHTHLIHADVAVALAGPVMGPSAHVSTKHGYEESYNNDHGFDPAHRRKDTYFRACQLVERSVDRSYAISHGLRRFFVETGLSRPDRISVIHYGFDFPTTSPPPADDRAFRFGTPQLVLVGRLVRFKGHRFAIAALPRIRAAFPDVRLVIVGSGPLEEEIRADAVRHGVADNVVMTGYKSNVHDYMAASDLVLVPSISEGFGVVFLEAFRNRKPVVAFDVPAANEIITDGVSGVLVKPYDVERYADAVVALLHDRERAVRVCDAAEARLRTYFTLSRMTAETTELYRDVLARRRASS